MTGPVRVLFLCTHNSARSQMAEGLLRAAGGAQVDVFSAGTVATSVRPEAIVAMAEIGIDISGQISKTLDQYLREPFELVITVCDSANDTCPMFPGPAKRIHWSIPDPSGITESEEDRLAAFRAARDDLRERISRNLLPQVEASRN